MAFTDQVLPIYSWCGKNFGRACIEAGHQIKCPGCGEYFDKTRYECPTCRARADRQTKDERDKRQASREKIREQYLRDQEAAKKKKADEAKAREKAKGDERKKQIDRNNKDLTKKPSPAGGNKRRRKIARRRRTRR